MLMISSRKSFFQPEEIAPEIQMAKVSTDGTFSKVSPSELSAYKNKRVLILVHGYNKDKEGAIEAYHEIREKMHKALLQSPDLSYDGVIGYLWPGMDSPLEYFHAKDNVIPSAEHLREQLQQF